MVPGGVPGRCLSEWAILFAITELCKGGNSVMVVKFLGGLISTVGTILMFKISLGPVSYFIIEASTQRGICLKTESGYRAMMYLVKIQRS